MAKKRHDLPIIYLKKALAWCTIEASSGAFFQNARGFGKKRELSMKKTTLCYIEKDDHYLMLHRIRKKNDVNQDKWIGIGGHFEEGETPEECILREAKEETGLTLTSFRLRGLVEFISDIWPDEVMYLFTADEFTGEMTVCDEGELEWVGNKDQVMSSTNERLTSFIFASDLLRKVKDAHQ